MDEQTTKIIALIYDFVFSVELITMPDCKTANAVKLTTNVFRDINIAFVNELSLMFEKLGIDTLKVLDAAKRKYNFQIHYPGAGVGGPCLPINSYQFLNTAKRIGSELNIVKHGRAINEKMPDHVINLTLDGFKKCNKSIKDSTILILGVSYKPDVKDIQLSPAEIIINKLKALGAKIKIYDPYYKNNQVFGINVEHNIQDILSDVDASIIITAHKEFQEINPKIFTKMKTPILIDSRGIIDISSANNVGLVFRGLGRSV
jgi:nucleotide sugar dehydrogenase